MIKISYAKLRSQDTLQALRNLSDAKLDFASSYQAMRIMSKVDQEIKHIETFLAAKMKENISLIGKKEEELTPEEKTTIQALNSSVEEFMKGEACIDKNPIKASALSGHNFSATTLHILMESNVVVDDIEVENPTPVEGEQNG